MKIGLIGAPGSGKTLLAEALADALHLKVIDDYVQQLEARTGYVFGKYATYAGNIALGWERHIAERIARDDFITCGTMLDTVTYMAAKTQIAADDADTRRLTGGLVVLGCMVDDMMSYDHQFLLPSEQEDTYLGEVANGLEEAVGIFGADYALLDQSSIEAQAQAALAHIEWVKENREAAPAE